MTTHTKHRAIERRKRKIMKAETIPIRDVDSPEKHPSEGYNPSLNSLQDLSVEDRQRIYRKKFRILCPGCRIVHHIPSDAITESLRATCGCGRVVFKLIK